MTKQKGFTLIELLIVIAIIAVLATLALVSLTAAQQRSRDTKRVADMKSMQTALELYYSENADYPKLGAEDGDDNNGIEVGSTWPEVSESMRSFISSLPVAPTNTGTDVYTYYVKNDTLDNYVIRAELEDETHIAFAQDPDRAYGESTDGSTAYTETAAWASISSSGAAFTAANTAAASTPVTIDCTDANLNYCLLGTASE